MDGKITINDDAMGRQKQFASWVEKHLVDLPERDFPWSSGMESAVVVDAAGVADRLDVRRDGVRLDHDPGCLHERRVGDHLPRVAQQLPQHPELRERPRLVEN